MMCWNTQGLTSTAYDKAAKKKDRRPKYVEITRAMVKHEADVVLLQETHLDASVEDVVVKSWFPGYHIASRRDRTTFRSGTSSKGRHGGGVLVLVSVNIETTATELPPTTFVAAGDDATEVAAVRLGGVHFVNVYRPPIGGKDDERKDLFTMERMPTSDAVIAGDFNAHHNAWDAIQREDRWGRKIAEWIAAHGQLLNGDHHPTWFNSAEVGRSTPDICCCTRDVNAGKCKVLASPETSLSDHSALLFTVQVPELARRRIGTRMLKFVWKLADWEGFSAELENTLPSVSRLRSPEYALKVLTVKILRAAHRHIPRQQPRKCRKAWWDEKLNPLVVQRHRARMVYAASPTPQNCAKWRQAALAAEDAVAKAKERHAVRVAKDAAAGNTVFRGLAAMSEGEFRIPSHINHDGRRVETEGDLAEVFADVFQASMAGDDDFTSEQEVKELLDAAEDVYARPGADFTLEELADGIRGLQMGKAAGPDRVSNEMLAHLGVRGRAALLEVYNKCWRLRLYPAMWRDAAIAPLLKHGKDPHLASSYRPISLTSNVGKLYERIILRRLRHIAESPTHSMEKPHLAQAGGRKMRSTEECIAVLTDRLTQTRADGRWSITLFFDLKGAFDRVPRRTLIRKLYAADCPKAYLQLIWSFIGKRTARARVFSTFSETRGLSRGVPQGAVLSPFLFLYFVDDLLRGLWRVGHQGALMYADDLGITVNGSTLTEAAAHAQDVIDFVERWCAENGMTLSRPKSTFMVTPPSERATAQAREVALVYKSTARQYPILSVPPGELARMFVDGDLAVFEAYDDLSPPPPYANGQIVAIAGVGATSRADVLRRLPPPGVTVKLTVATPMLRDDKPRYLGVIIDSALTGEPQLRKALRGFHWALNRIKAFHRSCHQRLAVATRRLLYQSVALPALTYGLAAWGPLLDVKANSTLAKAHIGAMKFVLDVNENVNEALLCCEARLHTTLHLIDIAAARLWDRCHRVTESLGALNLAATGRTSVWQRRAREAIGRTKMSALTYSLRDDAEHETPAVKGAFAPWTQAPPVVINATLPDVTRRSSPEEVRTAFDVLAADLECGADFVAYSDGSEKNGWAAHGLVYRTATNSAYTGQRSTDGVAAIADAELAGINSCLVLAGKSGARRAVVYTDSSSALLTVRRGPQHQTTSKGIVFWRLVYRLAARGTEVVVQWIPGHKGIPGNELADSEAKAATKMPQRLIFSLGAVKKLLSVALRRVVLTSSMATHWRALTTASDESGCPRYLCVRPQVLLTPRGVGIMIAIRLGTWSRYRTPCPGCHQPVTIPHVLGCIPLGGLRKSSGVHRVPGPKLVTSRQDLLVAYLHACGLLGADPLLRFVRDETPPATLRCI